MKKVVGIEKSSSSRSKRKRSSNSSGGSGSEKKGRKRGGRGQTSSNVECLVNRTKSSFSNTITQLLFPRELKGKRDDKSTDKEPLQLRQVHHGHQVHQVHRHEQHPTGISTILNCKRENSSRPHIRIFQGSLRTPSSPFWASLTP